MSDSLKVFKGHSVAVSRMAIIWGGISFDGPYPITSWDPLYRAAVYAIMVKTNDEYRIIYFGESSNLSDRGFWRSHHKYKCFVEQAVSESKIYIGIHKMPGSTEEEGKKVEQNLIEQYKPPRKRKEPLSSTLYILFSY